MADYGSKIEVICLDSPALKGLIDEVATRLKIEFNGSFDTWISEEEAKQLLRIQSKTTLHKYRIEGKIDARKLSSKQILYRRDSIMSFIENSPK